MSEFNVSLVSNASMNHYPDNTISSFRNNLSPSIRLNSNNYEVALTSCTYIGSKIFIHKGDIVANTIIPIELQSICSVDNLTVGTNKRICTTSSKLLGDIQASEDYEDMKTFLDFINSFSPHTYTLNKFNYIEKINNDNLSSTNHTVQLSSRVEGILGIHYGYNDIQKETNTTLTSHNEDSVYIGKHEIIKTPIIFGENETIYVKTLENGKEIDIKAKEHITSFSKLFEYLDDWIEEFKVYNSGQYYTITFKNVQKNDTFKFSSQVIMKLGLPEQFKFLLGRTVDAITQLPKIYLFQDEFIMKLNGITYNAEKDYDSFSEVIKKVVEIMKINLVGVEANKFKLRSKTNFIVPEMSSKILGYMGWTVGVIKLENENNLILINRAKYKIYPKLGKSMLFIYSNLVENQYVGDAFAPLLRTIPYITNKNNGEISEHEFINATYIPLQKNEFDNIHMYITSEDGEQVNFESRTFKATINFRQRE